LNSHQQNHGLTVASTTLTPRESAVAELLSQGYMIQNAASILGMSPRTAEAHRRSIYVKLGVMNRCELTLKAITLGVIDCPCQQQTFRRAA